MPLVKNFDREYKFTLGEKIFDTAIELVVGVYKANVKDNEKRKQGIEQILENVQRLGLFLRIGHDLKLISIEHYAQVVEMLDNISRQSTGWLISISGKPSDKKSEGYAPEFAQATA